MNSMIFIDMNCRMQANIDTMRSCITFSFLVAIEKFYRGLYKNLMNSDPIVMQKVHVQSFVL